MAKFDSSVMCDYGSDYAISMLEIASIAFSAWQRSAVSCYQHDEGRECYSSTSMRIRDIHVIGNWIMTLNRFSIEQHIDQ